MSITSFRLALRKARTAKGLTIEQTADVLRIPPNTYKSWERRGGRTPSIEMVEPITRTLGVDPVNALLGSTGLICQQPGKRDAILLRWVSLAEEFLAEVRKVQSAPEE
jgi:transcriptional regulator with XRE-family HTH domain